MFKRILLAVLLMVGVMAIGTLSAQAAPVRSVGIVPLQQTLSYTNGAYTGSVSIMVSNSSGTACITVPRTFSLGGQTVSVASRTIIGSAWWTNDPQVCGDGNYTVIVAVNAQPSSGTFFTPGTYTYSVTSDVAGYKNLSADFIVPTVKYYVRSYDLAYFSSQTFMTCDVSQPMNGHPAGDYSMCQIVPINNTNPKSSGYNSIFIQGGSFMGAAGDYIGDYIGPPDTGETTQLNNYLARIKGGVFAGSATKRYSVMINTGTLAFPKWTPDVITEVAIDSSVDFSNKSKIMVYSSQVFGEPTQQGVLSITPTSATMDASTTVVEFEADITKSNGEVINVTNLAATSWKTGDASVLVPVNSPFGCWYYAANNAPKTKCTQEFKLIGSRPSSPTIVTVTVDAYGYSVSAPVTILPATAPKDIKISVDTNFPSFSGNSANQTQSLTVTIVGTGIPAKDIIRGYPSIIAGNADFYVVRHDYSPSTLASTTDPITGNSTTTIQFDIVRKDNYPPTVVTGNFNLTASGDGVNATPITIYITINIGGGTCSLSLDPKQAVKSFSTNQLPTTASFPFTLTKTGTCGTITYTPALFPDSATTQAWVSGTQTQSSYTATVNLPQDAINSLPLMGAIYPLIGGVTATDVSGASTTALWATVIGKTGNQPALSLQVSPLSGSAPLPVSVTATTTGFSSVPTTYKFSFGDGSVTDVLATNVDSHTYADTGATTTYTVLVEASNVKGESAWNSQIVTVGPGITTKGNKTLSFTVPATISVSRPNVNSSATAPFTGTVSWNTNLSSSANLSISSWTGIPGATLTYLPSATCSGAFSASPCTVAFTVGNITNTTPTSTSFTMTAKKDGVTATSNLITLNLTNPIVITNPNPLSATLAVSPSSGAGPLQVAAGVNAQNGNSPYSYQLNFGDGYVVSSASAVHVYNSVTATTTYTVTGTVTDAGNSSASDTKLVTVYPANKPAVTPVSCVLTVNKPEGLPPFRPTFTVTPAGGDSGSYTVTLDPTGTGSPIYSLQSPYSSNPYIFTTSGQYVSKATVSDTGNPSNTASCSLSPSLKVLSGSGGETNAGQ
ncbi:MAG: PKD domain-containing protein [Patescibacteria group bacterium]|nr:PKD domain-containing protein [Patescibacteria group bacterium]